MQDRLAPKDQPAVLVIAPANVPVQVWNSKARVLRFASYEDFERWRKRSCARMEAAVFAALAELRVDVTACSPRTQEVLAQLKERETVPSVKELLAKCSSRRSFYRSWSRDLGEQPAAFLDRVRLLHLWTSTASEVAQPGTWDPTDRVR